MISMASTEAAAGTKMAAVLTFSDLAVADIAAPTFAATCMCVCVCECVCVCACICVCVHVCVYVCVFA